MTCTYEVSGGYGQFAATSSTLNWVSTGYVDLYHYPSGPPYASIFVLDLGTDTPSPGSLVDYHIAWISDGAGCPSFTSQSGGYQWISLSSPTQLGEVDRRQVRWQVRIPDLPDLIAPFVFHQVGYEYWQALLTDYTWGRTPGEVAQGAIDGDVSYDGGSASIAGGVDGYSWSLVFESDGQWRLSGHQAGPLLTLLAGWYTVELIADQDSQRIRVYPRGDTPPDWQLVESYGEGLVTPSGYPDLIFISGGAAIWEADVDCSIAWDQIETWSGTGGAPSGASLGGGIVGQKIQEVVVPLSGQTDGIWPIGTEWRTVSAAYLEGATDLFINGLLVYDKVETDPAAGIITINVNVYPGDSVILSYFTNGPLP